MTDPRAERAARVWQASRNQGLSAADQRALAIGRRLQQVQQLAAEHGVSPSLALETLTALEQQDAVVREVVDFAAGLSAADLAYLAKFEQIAGAEGVLDVLTRSGRLSIPALQSIGATLTETGGLAGTVERVRGLMQERATAEREAFIAGSVQRHTPQQGDSPIASVLKNRTALQEMSRDPEVQRRALAILEAANIRPRTDKSALEQVAEWFDAITAVGGERMPFEKGIDSEAGYRLIAEKTGDSVEALKAFHADLQNAQLEHSFVARMARKDFGPEAQARRQAMAPDAETRARMDKAAAKRRAIEARYDEIDAATPARPKPAPKPAPPARDGVGRFSRTAGNGQATRPLTPPESRRAALESAYDAIDAEGPTEGTSTPPEAQEEENP